MQWGKRAYFVQKSTLAKKKKKHDHERKAQKALDTRTAEGTLQNTPKEAFHGGTPKRSITKLLFLHEVSLDELAREAPRGT